jgi:hypothetical protein
LAFFVARTLAKRSNPKTTEKSFLNGLNSTDEAVFHGLSRKWVGVADGKGGEAVAFFGWAKELEDLRPGGIVNLI